MTNVITDEQASTFFKELKKDLHWDSTRQVASLVRLVISKVRGNFTIQEIGKIVSSTPAWFHLLLLSHWRYADDEKDFHHLDEIVTELIEQDKDRDQHMFNSEIQALEDVIIVLTKTQKLFRNLNINLLNFSLNHELDQAVLEEAV